LHSQPPVHGVSSATGIRYHLKFAVYRRAAARKRCSIRAKLQQLVLDRRQFGVARKDRGFKVVSPLVGRTLRPVRSTETLNTIESIADRQPRIRLGGRDHQARIDKNQPGCTSVIHFVDLVTTAETGGPSAKREKRNVRAQASQNHRDFIKWKRPLEKPLQSDERDSGIRAATTQAAANRNIRGDFEPTVSESMS